MTNPTTPAELMQANAVILLDEVQMTTREEMPRRPDMSTPKSLFGVRSLRGMAMCMDQTFSLLKTQERDEEWIHVFVQDPCPLCTDDNPLAEPTNENVCDECKHDATWS